MNAPQSAETVVDVPFPSWEAWCDLRNGPLMPRLENDRDLYESQKRFAAEHVAHTKCVSCSQRFSDDNCFTQEGWQETQISGLCERCFDQACLDAEDEAEGELCEHGIDLDEECEDCLDEAEDDEWDGDENW